MGCVGLGARSCSGVSSELTPGLNVNAGKEGSLGLREGFRLWGDPLIEDTTGYDSKGESRWLGSAVGSATDIDVEAISADQWV
jgi:hypothetical protein